MVVKDIAILLGGFLMIFPDPYMAWLICMEDAKCGNSSWYLNKFFNRLDSHRGFAFWNKKDKREALQCKKLYFLWICPIKGIFICFKFKNKENLETKYMWTYVYFKLREEIVFTLLIFLKLSFSPYVNLLLNQCF